MELGDYVESLYQTENFEDAFEIFNKEVKSLGFEAVLYTFIPKIMVDQSLKPVYAVSGDYCPEYINHYNSARYDLTDPLIEAVVNGESQPIDWWGGVLEKYANTKNSREVINTAKSYGIKNGLTIPLMSGDKGISGASFISSETRSSFLKLLQTNQQHLKLRTEIFHNMVVSNSQFTGEFIRPILESLSDTEKSLLAQLAKGKNNRQIACDLNRSEKYLEQVMLKIRRKLSGVNQNDAPTVNRNQVLYYAGLLNMLETL